MLYLEDYVELIEHLPSDLRERFTAMRETDLQVQNTVDSLEQSVEKLFEKCVTKKGKIPGADQVFEEIRNEYYKALEDADEKVQLANQLYDLVDRHLRKLDQELSKFKMEVEADHAGITEIIEKRFLENDNQISQKTPSANREKRKRKFHNCSSTSSFVPPENDNGEPPTPKKLKKLEYATESKFDDHSPSRADDGILSNSNNDVNSLTVKSIADVKVELHDIAEQALFPTELLHSQPNQRLSSSGSYEVAENNHLNLSPTEVDNVSIDSTDFSEKHITDFSLDPMLHAQVHRPSRTKKQTSKAAAWVQERMQNEARHGQRRKEDRNSTSSTEDTTGIVTDAEEVEGTRAEWNYDPSEPRYCVCNQVSYGAMVGCDNDKCHNEWFHYDCVGLTEAPKGKWYCPQCTQTMKRRKTR